MIGALRRRFVGLAQAFARLPRGVRAALAFCLLLHVVGITWGLPSSDAWDVDGVAPRDFLPGLAQTYSPGEFYTYPPLHLALLAVVTAPVTLVAVLRAAHLDVPSVMHVILAPPYMTAMTAIARVVTLLMSLGIVLTLTRIAEEIAPDERKEGTATATAWFASLGWSFTYYAHTTNLDVPYLFWAMLAVLSMVRAVVRCEPRRLRHVALAGACAIATKDQAYAMFLLGAPAALVAWLVADPRARAAFGKVLRETAIAAVLAGVVLAVIDGAVVNPSGFRARVAFLTGEASKDFFTYSADAKGRLTAFVDTFTAFRMHYPPVLAVLVLGGFAAALVSTRRAARAAALVPLFFALSFTFFFNLVALRAEERFTLPQALLWAVYGGFGAERAWAGLGLAARSAKLAGRAVVIALFALAAVECVRVDASMIFEPRYEAEAYLLAHATAADTIEVHGLNVYLPRFQDLPARVVRVGPKPPAKRGPIPGVEEVQAPLSDIDARRPRFVVVSGCYEWRYLERDLGGDTGRIVPPTQRRDASDPDATRFFQGLHAHQLGYVLVLMTRIERFRPTVIHGSLGCPMFVFERRAPAP